MPREAPVTRAMREARGRVIEEALSAAVPANAGTIRREGYDGGRRSLYLVEPHGPAVMGPCVRRDDTMGVSSLPPAATIAAAAARFASCRSAASDIRR